VNNWEPWVQRAVIQNGLVALYAGLLLGMSVALQKRFPKLAMLIRGISLGWAVYLVYCVVEQALRR
jgi:hypothetical protein